MLEIIETIDFAILDGIQAHFRSVFSDWLAIALSFLGGAVIWAVMGVIFCWIRKYRWTGIQILVVIGISVLLSEFVLKLLFLRERPYIMAEFPLIVAEPFGTSFPSTHTLQSFACGMVFFRIKKWCGIVALAFAMLVGLSRIYLYVHFPSDVLIAAIIGLAIGWLSSLLFRRVENYFKSNNKFLED